MKILFLYTELAGYTVDCINEAIQSSKISEIIIVRYSVNPEAPFSFSFNEGITVFEKNQIANLDTFIDRNKVSVIICSGWSDKDYLRVCFKYRRKYNLVITMDNKWEGSLKQRLFTRISKFILPRIFKYIWVPGSPQVEYAQKIGFNESNIVKGFYSIPVKNYLKLAEKRASRIAKQGIPKVVICVARYIAVKEWDFLWDEFIKFREDGNQDWQLWCIGVGEDFDKKIEHEGIKHFGFMQQKELSELMLDAGYFVLASSFEPWGVVVQEFAAAGFPLILSDKIGSNADLLKMNGFKFNSHKVGELEVIFKQVSKVDIKEYKILSNKSVQNAKVYSSENWVRSLYLFGIDTSV